MRLAVETRATLVEDGVDEGPATSGGGIESGTVQPGARHVGERGTDGITVDVEVGDGHVVDVGVVTTTLTHGFIVVVERTDGRGMLDSEVGLHAAG